MNEIQKIFSLCHSNTPLDLLIPTNKKHIYKTSNDLVKVIYFDGYCYDSNYSLQKSFEIIKEARQKEINRIKTLIKENKWIEYFETCSKKIGLSVLVRDFDIIPDEQKYDSFIAIYIRSEYGFEILTEEFISKVFSYKHLSKERKKRLRKLKGKEFKIYHGINYDYNPNDIYSWTLSKKVAEWFAFRFNGKGEVIETTITKKEVIDYLTDRKEEEILYIKS